MEELAALIASLGYPGLFIATLLMFMVFPLPAQPIMLLAGILIGRGEMQFVPALLFSTLGGMAGAFINYFIAYRLGRQWLLKRFAFFIHDRNLERLEWFFNRYGARSLLIGLSVPSMGQMITLPAGLAKMQMRVFAPIVFLGALIWCGYLIALGLFFGERIDYIKTHLTFIGTLIGVLMIFLLISFYVLRRTIFKYYRTIRWRDAQAKRNQTGSHD